MATAMTSAITFFNIESPCPLGRVQTRSDNLDKPRRAHAAADAHRAHRQTRVPAFALDQGVTRESGARHAVWVSERDRATVHVEPVVRNAKLVSTIEDLHGERLIELPQVDIGDLLACPFEEPGYREYGADPHFIGFATCDRKAPEEPQGFQSKLLRARRAHDDACPGPIGELARVAGSDDTVRRRGTDLRDRLVSGVRADALVLAHRHLARRQSTAVLVRDAGHHVDGRDLVDEPPRGERRRG